MERALHLFQHLVGAPLDRPQGMILGQTFLGVRYEKHRVLQCGISAHEVLLFFQRFAAPKAAFQLRAH
jgi:hypothetical protein